MNVAELRREYQQGALHRRDLDPDPIRQFDRWISDAAAAGIIDPNAMTLATAGRDGIPTARIVLLKGVDAEGFTFFTNYLSPKGRHIAENAHVELCFWWDRIERTVRIHGLAERVPRDESLAYFRTRPRPSQIGAAASDQSQTVPDRAALEKRFAELEQEYEGREIPMPQQWGGYRVRPISIEFWQGRASRLHDRFRYVRQDDDTWRIERLQP